MRLADAAVPLLLAASGSAQGLEPRTLERVLDFATFERPVHLTHAGDGSRRLFVVEQPGAIRVLRPEAGTAATFLDIRDRVNSGPNEAGLLSVAFHPDYAANGRLFVDYTHGDLVSRVSEFRVSADDPDAVDPASEAVLLEVDQPAGNHNGGQLAFGPDGMLYVGFGDGGGSGDTYGNGQNPKTLLGAILRLDVDRADAPLAYGVPPDNPFVGHADGWRAEIWAWGLRNPWRFSFDRLTGDLWAADVGQSRWEEVDLIAKGGNYGWNVMEGAHCYRAATCDGEGLLLPVAEYDRDAGISVTGGYVYRGARLSGLYGAYLYGDFGTRRIWALDAAAAAGGAAVQPVQIATSPASISSFGEDEEGEVHVVGLDGRVFRFVPLQGEEPRPTAVAAVAAAIPEGPSLAPNYPNPFNAATAIGYRLGAAGAVELTVLDLRGRRVATLVAGWRAAGGHLATWDGRDAEGRPVASGVYLSRLRAGGTQTARRMALVR